MNHMQFNPKFKPIGEWVEAERVDETGKCFKNNDHYYRQDTDKVLHVTDGLVNILGDNHIEESRVNWGDEYKEISNEEFERNLQKNLELFYSVKL